MKLGGVSVILYDFEKFKNKEDMLRFIVLVFGRLVVVVVASLFTSSIINYFNSSASFFSI